MYCIYQLKQMFHSHIWKHMQNNILFDKKKSDTKSDMLDFRPEGD